MSKYKFINYGNYSYINFLLSILTLLLIFQNGNTSPREKEPLDLQKSFRKLISGEDIVKQIAEECIDNSNTLKYSIVLNSTAFLANLNEISRRRLYTSIKDLDGQNIGMEYGKTFENLIKTNFPNSKINKYDSNDKLIMALLKGNIEGFLLEEPVAKYHASQMDTITYFKNKLNEESYGFAFPRNYTKEKRRSQFNEYLSSIKNSGTYDDILETWTGEFNSLKKIDKDLTGRNGVIYAGFNTEVPPFSYKEDDEIIGFEVDLLYRFAKKYNYKVEMISLNVLDQTSYLVNDKIDIVGGCYSITEDRKSDMFFSDSTYDGGTVLVTKKENQVITPNYPTNIDNNTKVIVKNQQGVIKFQNILSFPVTGLPNGGTVNGYCLLPENLTEIYAFDCNITDLTEDNPMVNGFEYGLITDIIEIGNITLNSLNSYIPSHILGINSDNEIEHQGTVCPKMNIYLAGVDNIEKSYNRISLEFGIYRKSIKTPETQATLKIIKDSDSCTAICTESSNKIYLQDSSVLVRYECSCKLSGSSSNYFVADFDSIKFSYTYNESKNINFIIKNKEATKNAMSNLNNNEARFPNNIASLNTFLVTKLNNGHCIGGTYTFTAIGVLYKPISNEKLFTTDYPIRLYFTLKVPYDREEAEIQMSINSKVKGLLVIRKFYYENQNNKGEYLYLTSKDNINIESTFCEGQYTYNPPYYINTTYNASEDRVETIELRDEMSLPKWFIVFIVLLIAALCMIAIYVYIQKMDTETEYIVKYTKTQNPTTNSVLQS